MLIAGTTRAGAAAVTFRVDMSVQAALGLFDPLNDGVFVAGSFNGWAPTAAVLIPDPSNSAIYEGTYDAGAVGTWPNYKFVKNRAGFGNQWENNGVGPNGGQNRWFQITSDPLALPVVFFNNITNASVNVTRVTFRVNMSVQIAQGTFLPGISTLTVAGSPLNEWSTTASPLSQTSHDTNLWEGTFSITNPIGGTVSYKYLLDGRWETVPNRTFVLGPGVQVLPVVHYNDVTNVAASIPLTFKVNMGVQIARGNFFPDSGDIVEVRGSFLTSPTGTWLGGFSLTNDLVNPTLFSGVFVDTNDTSGSVIQYQFVLNNGATWEIANRTFTLTTTNAAVLPTAYFNNVADLGPIVAGSFSGGAWHLTWEGGPLISLESALSPVGPWQSVGGTLGQSSAQVNTGSGLQFFRLKGP